MSGTVPIGNQTTIALAKERLFSIPAPGLLGYDSRLPVRFGLVRSEAPAGSIAPSGRLQRGLPDRVQGVFEASLPFRPVTLLEILEHIMLGSAKTNPEGAIFQYTSTDSIADCKDTSLFGLVGHSVEVEVGYGIKLSAVEISMGATGAIPVKLTGIQSHGTHHGTAVPAVGNTGTYLLGPWIRGIVKDSTAGDLWVKVISLGPLTFKALQSVAEPAGAAWTAATTVFTVSLDADLEGQWQPLQSSLTALDLGLFSDENKDPLEVVWPGKAADHADLAADDVFQFPLVATVPALTMLTGNRLGPAHWTSRFRAPGGSWTEIALTEGTITLETALDAPGGNGSRYLRTLDRTSAPRMKVAFSRTFYDRFFREFFNRHERLEMEFLFQGEQLGLGVYREGVSFTAPSMVVAKDDVPVANEGRIVEGVELAAEEDPFAAPATTIVVTTLRDFTPTA